MTRPTRWSAFQLFRRPMAVTTGKSTRSALAVFPLERRDQAGSLLDGILAAALGGVAADPLSGVAAAFGGNAFAGPIGPKSADTRSAPPAGATPVRPPSDATPSTQPPAAARSATAPPPAAAPTWGFRPPAGDLNDLLASKGAVGEAPFRGAQAAPAAPPAGGGSPDPVTTFWRGFAANGGVSAGVVPEQRTGIQPVVFGSGGAGMRPTASDNPRGGGLVQFNEFDGSGGSGGDGPPIVTLEDEYTSLAEGKSGGFLLYRTGDTGSDLKVTLDFPSPSTTPQAKLGLDFSIPNGAPAPSGGQVQVTIPAGSAVVSSSVLGLRDNLIEGTEYLRAELVDEAEYDVGAASGADFSIDDDPPIVTMSVEWNGSGGSGGEDSGTTIEGGSAGTLRFSRTGGDPDSDLNVYFTLSGTAHNGFDYPVVPGYATIPAKYADVTADLITIDDAKTEPDETWTFTLVDTDPATGKFGNYLIDGKSLAKATTTIIDNDALVSVVPDGNAAEAGTNGAFRVHREGSTSTDLTVNYTVSGSATPSADYTALHGPQRHRHVPGRTG